MSAALQKLVDQRVVASICMVALLLAGLMTAFRIRKELLPARSERSVDILVPFPGAGPEELQSSVLLPLEHALRGMPGTDRLEAEAYEGIATLSLRLVREADPLQVLGEVKAAVDRIDTLPADAEDPIIALPLEEEKVMSLVVHGDQPLLWLRRTAEEIRNRLRSEAGLSRVELVFAPDLEISIDVPEATLREHGFSLDELAQKVGAASLDLPAGSLYTEEVDVTVRTVERREWAHDYESIVVGEAAEGLPLRLRDIAILEDGFGDSTLESWFNGQPAILMDIYSSGTETPLSVETAVLDFLHHHADAYRPGVEITLFENQAEDYRSRMNLLIENAWLGLALVLVILGLFLTPRLAFWVLVGIPVSLLGGLALLPVFGASFNMLSMFAFIVTIGVVVDDAIMVGEAVHLHRHRGLSVRDATLAGLKEVGGPVILATATTIVAFLPMFFVPGELGELFRQIPAVVVAVLVVSLFESLFLLATHLSHESPERPWLKTLSRPQAVVNKKLEAFVQNPFRRFLKRSMRRPGLVLAIALSALLVTVGAIMGGGLSFEFTPSIAADTVTAQAILPFGTPREKTRMIQQRLLQSAEAVLAQQGMTSSGVFSCIGARLDEGEIEVETLAGSHYVSILLSLPPLEKRVLSGSEFAAAWREAFGSTDGLEALSISGETNVTGGEPVRLDVFHPDPEQARAAALVLGERMREEPGLVSVDDGIRVGKPELQVRLRDDHLVPGMTAEILAHQLRSRFHGAEASRFVRDGNEVKVMLRLPKAERSRPSALDRTSIQTQVGAWVPLSAVAELRSAQAFTRVARRDGQRIFPVTAEMRSGIDEEGVENRLEEEILPELTREFPGSVIRFGGEEEEVDLSLAALGQGFFLVVAAILFLLALQFNSWAQPLLILGVIPFSFLGALWGHMLLGVNLSIISVIGLIAMAGVVVNDSVVLVDAFNRNLAKGLDRWQAVEEAACRRFRPILLTSLTTFFGLVPLLLERSEQAQFLIPAAISISFGLLAGTVVVLTLVPVILVRQKTKRPACLPADWDPS